jgi:cysteine sulfinate desulfinase/cysteine desulfurase-like protein
LARQAEGRKKAEQERKEELREERKKKRSVLKERMEELEQIEEYFNLVQSSETVEKKVTTVNVEDSDVQVEVTTSFGIPKHLL